MSGFDLPAQTAAPVSPGKLGAGLIALLALLTALEALAIDLYLPGMPSMAVDLASSPARIQQTLAVFLIGLAIGQGLYGPLLDRFGRRVPLLIGVAVFVAGSVLAAVAPNVEVLLLARFVQAVGASAGLVAPRAIVADRCTLQESATVFALLMQVMMIGPIVAPLIGSWLLQHGGWRLTFWVLAAASMAALLWALVGVPETLPAAQRKPLAWASLRAAYGGLLRRRAFMVYTVAGGLVLGAFFAYIGGSAFVFTAHYGLSATQFSYVFAANSLGLVAGGFVSTALIRRGASTERVLGLGLAGFSAAAAVLLVATWIASAPLPLYAGLLCLAIASLGLVFGNLTALTMHHAGEDAGAASALMGTLQYLVAALVGVVVSAVPTGPAQVPLAMAVCGAVTWLACSRLGR